MEQEHSNIIMQHLNPMLEKIVSHHVSKPSF